MIKKLRKKLILITMIVITVVVFSIAGTINVTNYNKVINDSNQVMEIIISNDGVMPTPDINDIPQEPSVDNNNNNESREFNDIYLEIPFKTRFFTVIVSNDIDSATINTSNIFLIDDDSAKEYAKEVANSNKKSGFYKNYRYSVASTSNNETLYVFVDNQQEIKQMKALLMSSLIISISMILLIFILITIFSEMAVKPIADSYEKQKRFITDANHELKTPLTIIGATNEILQMQYGENEWSNTINNQVIRLTSLTEKLVLLSKMEEDNKDSIIMSNVALSSLIKEMADSFIPIATSSNKEYLIDIKPNVEKEVDVSSFKTLISILLDNAFKYSNDNGKVSISFYEVGKHYKLVVKNTVDEINKGDLDCLFERFYRLDKSRNSSTGGSGIGLSVAKAIATLHKGKIQAKSEDGKSLEIIFTF